MTLSGLGLHTLGSEHCTIKADLWLPYPALAAVEYKAVLCYSLHELDEVLVMVLGGMAVDTDVIMDGYDAWKLVSDLVHAHLEDVLAHLEAKGHVQGLVPSLVGCEGGQV